MGVFRTLVSAIVLMVTMFFLWTQSNTLSPYLMELKDTSIHMGYPILNNLERLMISDEDNNVTLNEENERDTAIPMDSSLPVPMESNLQKNNIKHPLTKPQDESVQTSQKSPPILQESQETMIESSCLPFNNSDEWWNQTRLSNIDNEPQLDPTYLYETLLDPWSTQVVNQSICHENSRFLDTVPGRLSDLDWQIRLLYLGLYLHQHLPAMKHIETRRLCQFINTSAIPTPQNVSISGDYHCRPDTKYLVVSLPAKGAGATFRAGAVPALLAGLATNRVVVFVNFRPFGSVQMRSLWDLASVKHCPRGDIQCYFLPITPCVLTQEEVRNSSEVDQASAVTVLADGRDGKGMINRRILVVNAKSAPLALFPRAERKMRARIYDLVKDVAAKYNVPPQVLENLRKSSNEQPQDLSKDLHGNYNRGRSSLHHAALLYLLRPNREFQHALQGVVQKAIPRDYDPEWSFGIPIRASDKCGAESTCLTFDQYMQLAVQQYTNYSTGTDKVASIVLTSEAASMMTHRHNYSTSSQFPFRFVVNVDDVTQGTGTPRRYRAKDAYLVMLSTMAAMKMQLMPKYSVVNCCSSFHQVILDLLRSGCGAVKSPDFRCLQETDDPRFHVCCEWNRDERCRRSFDDFRKAYENNTKDFT